MLDAASDDELVAGPVQFADPELLGDFLFGLFTLAREPVQRRPDLVARIDEVVMAFADAEFLDALPALRRAFSAFTPREKDRLARGLPGGARLDEAAAADPSTLAAMLELEGRLRGALERYGVEHQAERRARWLILGSDADAALDGGGLDAAGIARDRALGFLYDREQGDERNVRRGSLEDGLTVPDWLDDVHRAVPEGTIERLERDALERYRIHEMVTDADVLARVEPNRRC